ncbi:type II secretion system protein [Propionigenium maris]|nr:type II secretion system protein [Propionigenium maris]
MSTQKAPRPPWREAGTVSGRGGLTLVELLITISIMSILTLAIRPAYSEMVVKTREAALKKNLYLIREALDFYYLDNRDSDNKNIYPSALEELVTGRNRYLRYIPEDPITGAEEWYLVYATEGGIYDVRSLSTEIGSNNRSYSEW